MRTSFIALCFAVSLFASLSLCAGTAVTRPAIARASVTSPAIRPAAVGGIFAAPLSALLNRYYELKNALAGDDAAAASKSAAALLKAIDDIDPKTLTTADRNTFLSLKDKLSFDARHISEVQHVSHQREHFANLSLNMYELAKATKLSDRPVYKDYCPMKKTYWLSGDAVIKNPYLGKQMPACGKVEETLK